MNLVQEAGQARMTKAVALSVCMYECSQTISFRQCRVDAATSCDRHDDG